jgi:uncharacterized membrane protein
MVGMGSLTVVARDLVDVAADNGRWMTWNLILAIIPAAMAVVLFRHRGPRTALWWTGAAFIAVGLLAYALAVGEMGRYLTRIGLAHWRGPAEVATHALCAVGVVLGRLARLNSWEPVTEPHGTAERIVLTLSWRGAPFAVLLTFAVIWVCHGATRALVRHGIAAAGSAAATVRRLA